MLDAIRSLPGLAFAVVIASRNVHSTTSFDAITGVANRINSDINNWNEQTFENSGWNEQTFREFRMLRHPALVAVAARY